MGVCIKPPLCLYVYNVETTFLGQLTGKNMQSEHCHTGAAEIVN
jgi:hypothetical protein